MASSRQTTAPTSQRTGLGAEVFFRLEDERLADVLRLFPDAVRFPPVVFFGAVANSIRSFPGYFLCTAADQAAMAIAVLMIPAIRLPRPTAQQ